MTDSPSDKISSGDLADKFSELRGDASGTVPTAPTAAEIQAQRPIDRDDFVSKFSELQGGVDAKAGQAKGQAIQIAAIGAAVVTLIGFVLGLRRGKGKSTVVEIRRV